MTGHELANARSNNHAPAAAVAAGTSGGAATGTGRPPDDQVLTAPIAMTALIGTM